VRTTQLPDWLRDPGLAPVWDAARARLQQNGVEPRGTVTVRGLDRAGRHAVSGLLGRPVLRDTARIELAELDGALCQRSGVGGLVAVLQARGSPVRDRTAERSAAAARRQAPYAAARSWLDRRPDVAERPWVEEWLSGVRRSGVLARLGDGEPATQAILQALDIAAALTEAPYRDGVARNELSARHTGDAHALDDGSVRGPLVLRALALAAGEPPAASGPARRALWERYGVTADSVSSTCLTLGLRPIGDGGVAARLRMAADDGAPVHLTAWDLARVDLARGGPAAEDAGFGPATSVLVCENPRVLEAVAARCGGTTPVVCTSGMPGLVTLDVLTALRRSGVDLRYHGDFDWPGIAIANRLVARVGCRPWLLSAEDYLAAARPDGPPLQGTVVEPAWDAALAPAMRRHGVAVHEEAVLDRVLEQLRASRSLDGDAQSLSPVTSSRSTRARSAGSS
jgi:uncharacterized protein (TIGR02679 family)